MLVIGYFFEVFSIYFAWLLDPLLGPTNINVHAGFPSFNFKLCLSEELLKPIYPGLLLKVPLSVVSV